MLAGLGICGNDFQGHRVGARPTLPSKSMRYFCSIALLLVALIQGLPLLGVLGAARLSALYGIAVTEANLEILLRHRAVLFGMLAAFLAYAAFKPEMHRLALTAGLLSVGSFMALTMMVGSPNTALQAVFKVDIAALVLLLAAGVAHLRASSP
jgi:hypothetical protein